MPFILYVPVIYCPSDTPSKPDDALVDKESDTSNPSRLKYFTGFVPSIYLSILIVQSILLFLGSSFPFLVTFILTSSLPTLYSLPKILIIFSVVVSQSKNFESAFIFKDAPTLALSLLNTASSVLEKSNFAVILPVDASLVKITSQIFKLVSASIIGLIFSVSAASSPVNLNLSPRSNRT